MTFLNAQQLAFLLGIKKQDARAKMIQAYASDRKETPHCHYTKPIGGKLIEDATYPEAMPIEMLSRECNLPELQMAVNDINENYLNRPASKKWILCDYPEKQILKMIEDGKKKKISIPPALKSMLPFKTIQTIEDEWAKRFPEYNAIQPPVIHTIVFALPVQTEMEI